jgi:lipid-A-disaccharide synthase
VNATFVGHPLLDLVQPEVPVKEFTEKRGIDGERPVVGILPGSRRQEIQQILPVQLEAAAIIHKRVPGVQFVLALAPTVDREDVVRALTALRQRHAHLHDAIHRIEERLRAEIAGRRLPLLVTTQGTLVPPNGRDELSQRTRQQLADAEASRPMDFGLIIVENATYDVMVASDVLIVASGTATLEAAILGRPMVILYRLALSNALEYQFIKKSLPEFVGMPNILAQKRICPELLQDAATPEAVSAEVIALLLEPERMLKMKEDMRLAVAQLGERGGAQRTARMVIDLAEAPASEHESNRSGMNR